MKSAPWMEQAKCELGVREVPGDGNNPRIVEYAKAAKIGWYKSDVTPWCAVFVGAVLAFYGLAGTGSALARSYLSYGHKLDYPRYGAICVLKRGRNPMEGHVGFVVGHKPGKVLILGGNQSDAVCERWFDEADVLAYRWPVSLPSEVAVVEEPPKVEQKIIVRPVTTIPVEVPKPKPETSSSPPQRSDVPEGSRTIDATEKLQKVATGLGLIATIQAAIKAMHTDIGTVGMVALALAGVAGAAFAYRQALNIRAFRIEDHVTGKHKGR